MTTFLVLWIFFALIVGFISSARTLGFWGGFFLSLLLSPVIAFIIAMITKSKYQRDLENAAFQQMATPRDVAHMTQTSVADELAKLKKQMDDGVITQDEFTRLKSNLIG